MSGTDDDSTIIFSDIGQVLAQAEEEAKGKSACLLAIGGDLNHTLFELWPGTTTIGRAADVTFCLEFEGISRHHIVIVIDIDQQSETATIADMGSRNGTYLNNKRLENKEILSKGDIVKIGNIALQYIPHGDPERLTYDKLSIEANTDSLTGCFNRTYFSQAADAAVKKANMDNTFLSLLAFDIDHYTKVRDSIGPEGGDYILRQMAELIRMDCLRGGDICAHYGGDEFALMLPVTDLQLGLQIAESVRKAVEDYEFRYDFRKWPITISVGIAEVREGVATGKMLFKLACQGVRIAKDQGRNQVKAVQSPVNSCLVRSQNDGQLP